MNDLNQIIRLNLGTNLKSGEECAIKLEPGKTKFPQLYYEAKLYKIFNGAGKFPIKSFHQFILQLACLKCTSLDKRETIMSW